MSDQTIQPLTEGQKAILNSFPVLHPPVISLDDRMALTNRITTLLAVIEQAQASIEAFMNEDNWHGKGKVAPKWLLNQGNEALVAIRALKEGK